MAAANLTEGATTMDPAIRRTVRIIAVLALAAPSETFGGGPAAVCRWRAEDQNGMARMDWTVTPCAEANHPPVVRLNHADAFTLNSGQLFRFDAGGAGDPDRDSPGHFWFQCREAGTYKEPASFGSFAPSPHNVPTIRAPEGTSPHAAHSILKVTGKGTPALTPRVGAAARKESHADAEEH